MDFAIDIVLGVMVAATPLLFAALGELVAEKAGVLNLGVEGMMIVGAIAAFSTTIGTGSHAAGVAAAAAAGIGMAILFGILALTLRANQVASGLALTIFGLGISALWGQDYSGLSTGRFPRPGFLGEIPIVGRFFASLDPLVYLSLVLVAAVAWFLKKSRYGLILRAIGENHDAAHTLGYPVIFCRYCAVMFGGALAGIAGAYLSIVQTPLWVEKMTAGRGWIALALVVFAAWRPWRLVLGTYLFGGISVLQLHSQALGVKIDAQILSMLPYLATILVLVLISHDKAKVRLTAPDSLGKPFHAPH
ncbi:MAG TPA: ABC transporter permease [Hyphomicrobiales bacterium]|nr:ABC transporter permease [Hyphomicrobiales bacterium]